jgi:hypothetical protein
MAFRHGRFAEITVGGTALSLFCDTADLNIDVDMADVTTFTKSWKRAIAGLAGGTCELAGSYDPTAVTGPAAKLTGLIQAAAFAVVVEPGGNLTGQSRRTFNALIQNYKESSPVADKVTFSCTLMIDDAVTFATI